MNIVRAAASSSGTLALLLSNTLLSAYPILIKMYADSVTLSVQVLIRMAVYIGLTVPVLVLGGHAGQMAAALVSPKFLAISAVNLLHIYSSYKGFTYLNAGVSMTTFYSYPIIQVVLSSIFLQTRLTVGVLSNLVGCFLGLVVLNANTYKTGGPSVNVSKGLGFIALAALTEAMIGVFYKHINYKNPFMSLFTLYAPVGLLCLLVAAVWWWRRQQQHKEEKEKEKSNKSNSNNDMWKIVLFNVLIGGVGYLLRLFALTHIPLAWFSGLLFTSSVSAFVLGYVFLKEKIRPEHWLGTMVIFYNIYKLKLHQL